MVFERHNLDNEGRPTNTLAAAALFLLAGAFIVFVCFCLILQDFLDKSSVKNYTIDASLFISPRAIITYSIILAGVIGSSVRIIAARLNADNSECSGEPSAGGVASQIFLGGAFAFAAGFLIPHAAISDRLSDPFNAWSLMIIGAVSGYTSSLVTGGVQRGLEGLMTGLRQGVAQAIVKEEVAKTVADTTREALALPEPVAFVGIVEVDITDSNGVSAFREAGTTILNAGAKDVGVSEASLQLVPSMRYLLRICMLPRGAESKGRSGSPIYTPIEIEGKAGAVVPLDFRVDFGFLNVPAARRQLDVSTEAETALPVFEFITPTSISEEATTSPGGYDDLTPPRRITISVLQNKVPYVRQQIRVVPSYPSASPIIMSSP